ncbi:MAG: class I SAM-dependent methyltransferase [Armatimonadetes bacterium]|nr:class I SAM-dependent methyltransferase [Armatimonadota bacterium]
MTGKYVQVSQLGKAFLPGKFADVSSRGPMRRVNAEGDSLNQLARFVKRGGSLIITGELPGIFAVRDYLLRRENELLSEAADARERKLSARNLRLRLLTTLDCLPQLGFEPIEVAGFLGEESLPKDTPTLLPVDEAERLLGIPANECYVRAIGASVVTHPEVLAPQSQETIDLVCEAIKGCEPNLGDSPEVLDLGCGSGVLTVAAWQLLASKHPRLTATDILPEAVATTRFNWRRLSADGKAGPIESLKTHVGNLFEPVAGQKFDLVIFNAPWVVAPARTRAELALNDERQATIKAFLESSLDHLKNTGWVIVGYSSNAGPKAIARLESFIGDAGLIIERIHKDRIHTRRAKRQWQSIYAYVLHR